MTKLKFYSDVNFSVFKEYLDTHNIDFMETDWDVVEVPSLSQETEEEAYSLGAEKCP